MKFIAFTKSNFYVFEYMELINKYFCTFSTNETVYKQYSSYMPKEIPVNRKWFNNVSAEELELIEKIGNTFLDRYVKENVSTSVQKSMILDFSVLFDELEEKAVR